MLIIAHFFALPNCFCDFLPLYRG